MNGLGGDAALASRRRSGSGTPGAVLGYPGERPVHDRPRARRAPPGRSSPQDSYGRGPITRELTALRGEVRSGNSGGPLVDGAGG